MSKLWLRVVEIRTFVVIMCFFLGLMASSLLLVGAYFFRSIDFLSEGWKLTWMLPSFIIYSLICLVGLTYFSSRCIDLNNKKG